MSPFAARIDEAFAEHLRVAADTRAMGPQIEQAANLITDCLKDGGTILLCGNGGSAADAQHLAGEWVGRFLLERRGLPSIALHTNTTTVTAIANDYGYEEIYSRQVEAHGKPGDVLIAITTSGNSENVLRAAIRAREMNLKVIGMTAEGGGRLKAKCDICFAVPTPITARAQEMHILIGHLLCELSEKALFGDQA